MRIAIIGAEMLPLPAVKGGSIEEVIDGITPYIAAEHELTIISISDPMLPKTEIRNGEKYIRFPKYAYWSGIEAFLKQNKPDFDIIHVFNRPSKVPFLSQAAPSSDFILDVHNSVFDRSILSDTDAIDCVKEVNKIICVSDYIARTVVRRVPEAVSKVQTIYSGIDLNLYQPRWIQEPKRIQLRKKLGLEGKKVLLFTGRVLPKKGPHLLVEALKLLLPKYPDAVLLVVGSPWYSSNKQTDYSKKLVDLAEPIKNNIVFTNYVPQQEMQDYYLVGDIFLCPSQWQEPAGRVHYEAMAAGLPIITVNRGGIPEIVTNMHDGVVISNYRNPKAFANAIDRVLSDPAFAEKISKNGRKTVEKRFGFEQAAVNYLAVYKEGRC